MRKSFWDIIVASVVAGLVLAVSVLYFAVWDMREEVETAKRQAWYADHLVRILDKELGDE